MDILIDHLEHAAPAPKKMVMNKGTQVTAIITD